MGRSDFRVGYQLRTLMTRVVDFAVDALATKRERTLHVLIAPPGGGNIGDAAMVEAFIQRIDSPVALVVSGAGDFDLEVVHANAHVEIHALPGLLYGDALRFFRDYARLAWLKRRAISFSVVGADIMDGAYNERASAARSLLAASAARGGLNTRVLGFSWNASPSQLALESITNAARRGVRLIARDPKSRERLSSGIKRSVVLGADLVFLATNEAKPRLPFADELNDQEYVLVNVSALVSTIADQSTAYGDLVREITARGETVVLLPHVLKSSPAGDDLSACASVYAAVSDKTRVHIVERRLQPAEIRWLTRRASHVVTGRMHLAVMSLLNATPVAVIATQGKVEGLMEIFDQSRFLVIPDEHLHKSLKVVEGNLYREAERARSQILNALPAVRRAAMENLSDFPM